ncbi:hypothetical protein ZIOFF_028319 [Zingiber officinale]|uniref:Uncharacterized protein n=1 Tax=Zingiber officinale TaxID=94328 RepID=A0A8J5L3G9_ZINOF|nr:hypothetical protein ZIOFF_028319 [Zingiber officinale]
MARQPSTEAMARQPSTEAMQTATMSPVVVLHASHIGTEATVAQWHTERSAAQTSAEVTVAQALLQLEAKREEAMHTTTLVAQGGRQQGKKGPKKNFKRKRYSNYYIKLKRLSIRIAFLSHSWHSSYAEDMESVKSATEE